MLILPADDTPKDDPGAIRSVEEESGIGEIQRVGIGIILDVMLPPPFGHGHALVLDHRAQALCFVKHSVPAGVERGGEMVDVDVRGITEHQRGKAYPSTATLVVQSVNTKTAMYLHETG